MSIGWGPRLVLDLPADMPIPLHTPPDDLTRVKIRNLVLARDMCENTCSHSRDGVCDDGGANSLSSLCELGTDCADCGGRSITDPRSLGISFQYFAAPRNTNFKLYGAFVACFRLSAHEKPLRIFEKILAHREINQTNAWENRSGRMGRQDKVPVRL